MTLTPSEAQTEAAVRDLFLRSGWYPVDFAAPNGKIRVSGRRWSAPRMWDWYQQSVASVSKLGDHC